MKTIASLSLGTLMIAAAGIAHAEGLERINPSTIVDTSPWGFTQVVVAPSNAKTVYISGQFSGDIDGNVLGKTVGKQAEIAFSNLRKAIAASGGKPEHVVKIQVLVAGHGEDKLHAIKEQADKLFGQHLPASTLIPVDRLALDGMLFEIDATLAIPQS
ncbi:RidA family protein [Pseudovibrio ascidiaceicola]|uniref:RidA family protein n=1 Tax=Pseudovibrio ascidiaceicola TaxID=285279 RepID=UPI000D691243|nr:RidA family protein [Pseudovibrio ascidiaceicola]